MPTLTQQETFIRAAAYKGFYTIAATSPSVTDDRNKGFIFGSRWLRTTVGSEEEFVCLNNNPGAAVWVSTTAGGGGGGGVDPHIAAANPTVNDDTGDGYVVGQLWLNTILEKCFIAMDVSTGAAVWTELTGGGGGGGANIYTFTSAPTVNDDVSIGYLIGDIWVRTTNDKVYLCADNTDGAAVWVEVNATVGMTPYYTTTNPTVNDDSGDGYQIGQLWINTTTDTVFCATDVTVGAAVWKDLSTAGGSSSINEYQRTIAATAIASARVAVTHTPQLLYDGFADGCLDLDGANAGTTTYMVSNATLANQTTPTEVRASGTVSASSVYGAGYEADKAVDGSDATRWSAAGGGGSRWYQIDFGSGNAKRIVSIVIKRSQYDGAWTPVVERSSDGSSWTAEYTHSALPNAPLNNTEVTFSFIPSGAYRYWRLIGTFTGQDATWNDFKIYEENLVTSPIYESATRAMPYRPVKATVVIAAYINTLTLNTNFVAKFSSNGGTNYETVTLTEICNAPYGANVKLYAGTITTVDRGTQNVRIKIEGGSTFHSIYGVAFIGHQYA